MDKSPVTELLSRVSEKHQKFLETVGEIPYKVSADRSLLLAMVTSKISLVASMMKLSGVIDEYSDTYEGECNIFTLTKEGLDFSVEILTNGTCILMRSSGPAMSAGLDELSLLKKRFYPKDDEWDWEKFSDDLLSYIHQNMYSSQKSEEINFDMLMKGMSI